MAALSSMDMNMLVFRYLSESGFTHAAFSFGYEADMQNCPIDGNLVPPGALVNLVQKGLQFIEMEANASNDDTNMDEDFTLLKPLELITNSADELKQIINDRKRKLQEDNPKPRKLRDPRLRLTGKRQVEGITQEKKKSSPRGDGKILAAPEKALNISSKDNVLSKDVVDIVISSSQASQTNISDMITLEGHTDEVFACAWSPTGSILASGSGDSTARIWSIGSAINGSRRRSELLNVLVLKHGNDEGIKEPKNVTTVDWNGQGTLLATGSYDGQARIWTADGELKSIFGKHQGPIFSVRWNKKGDYILTGSSDKTAMVWDVKAKTCKQHFGFHSGPILDIDWRNNVSFATSSADKMIYVCKVGEARPIKAFAGHENEVNCIKWDPSGQLLVSGSDDLTVKVWSSKKESYIHDLKEHTEGIYTIKWSPTGPGTSNPNQKLVVASGSFDSTVKLWDIEKGRRLCSLNHKKRVYAMAFSPNGEYLASGSRDETTIWSVKEGKIVKTYADNGSIFDICWNKEGDRIAVCFSNHSVKVIDFRM